MTNHVHLLATPERPGVLATKLQSLGRRYVRYVNATDKRSGTLWEGRYKAGAVDADDYLLRVSRYIELNPVRANMVLDSRDYGWSSYACNGEGRVSDWLVAHPLYAALGETPAASAVTYAKMFETEIDPDETARIRTAVHLGIGVKDARFREEMERAQEAKRKGGRKKKGATPAPGQQVDLFEKNGYSDAVCSFQ